MVKAYSATVPVHKKWTTQSNTDKKLVTLIVGLFSSRKMRGLKRSIVKIYICRYGAIACYAKMASILRSRTAHSGCTPQKWRAFFRWTTVYQVVFTNFLSNQEAKVADLSRQFMYRAIWSSLRFFDTQTGPATTNKSTVKPRLSATFGQPPQIYGDTLL